MYLQIVPNTLNAFKKVNLKNVSNPISFHGLDYDTFTKSDTESTERNITAEELCAFDDKISTLNEKLKVSLGDDRDGIIREIGQCYSKLNPNTAFLFDDKKSWTERKAELKNHPEIISLKAIDKAQTDACYRNIYYSSPYFVTTKTSIGKFVDTSFELNKNNYEILNNENMLSFSQFCNKYNFSIKDLKRYIKLGYFTPLQLENLRKSEKEDVNIINTGYYETIKTGVKRNKKLSQTFKPKFSEFMPKPYLYSGYLAKLGFGTKQDLEDEVKYKNLDGKKVTTQTENGEKEITFIRVDSPRAQGMLKYLRNQNTAIADKERFCKLARIDETDLEDAFLDGKIEIIPETIFEDDDKVYFDLKNKKNIEFISQKQLEYETRIVQKMLDKEEKRRENAKLNSLFNQIKWQLCPNTKRILGGILHSNSKFQEVFEKSKEVEEYRRKLSAGEIEEDENEPYLTEDERIILRKIYKIMWSKAGFEENTAAQKRIAIAKKEYKTGGIDAISDMEIKDILQQYLNDEQMF